MIDIERSCALLSGRILNAVAIGNVCSTSEEQDNAALLALPILRNGLQADYTATSKLLGLTVAFACDLL